MESLFLPRTNSNRTMNLIMYFKCIGLAPCLPRLCWVLHRHNRQIRKKGSYGHRIRFFFPLDGINKYNPFTWLTIGNTVMALTWFSKVSFRRWKSVNDVEVTQYMPKFGFNWPEEPINVMVRKDGSIPYMRDGQEAFTRSSRSGSSSIAKPPTLTTHIDAQYSSQYPAH